VHAVASGLANALAYLHTAFDSPVIHRDVKPAKVMMRLVMRNVGTAEPVRSQFVAALGGFGTAVHLNDEARVEIDDSDPMRSKLRAPEPTCSPALDIYSLGIVLHEVLTLNIPYYTSCCAALCRSSRCWRRCATRWRRPPTARWWTRVG
jgi:serine/threonine protein kinase